MYTAHGYGSNEVIKPDINMWNVEENYKLMDTNNHHEVRVLAIALNKYGNLMCSLGADELLKVWTMDQKDNNYTNHQRTLIGNLHFR